MAEHSAQEQNAPKGTSRCPRAVWLAAFFGVATFVLNYAVECRLNSLQVFGQYNILFDADPNTRLDSICSGVEGRSLIHPHLSNVFSLPIMLVGKVAIVLGLDGQQEIPLRRSLGLLVVPVASGLTASVWFFLFLLLGLSVWRSSILTSLGAMSFSQLVFGSMPDHFAVGGLALALCYLLAADDLNRGGRVRWLAWMAAGMLTMGITATNVITPAVLLFTCLLRRGWGVLDACRRTIAFGAIVSVITYATAIACSACFGDMDVMLSEKDNITFVGKYWTDDAFHKAMRLPALLANTIAPPSVGVMPNTVRGYGERYDIEFTLESTTGVLPVLICGVLLVSGTIGGFKGTPSYRVVAMASVAILALNLIMHTFFGRESFLYSQHWLTPLLVLLGGNLSYRGPCRNVGICLLGTLLAVAVAANSVARLLEMFSKFAA